MSRRVVVGTFEEELGLLGVARAAREEGLKIIDAYAPYAVHGLDDAMGLPPSRLPWVCFFAGITGAALKLWFEFWTTMVDWPVNVGGKPWNSLPAFVPVTFEVMVLSAGLTTVFVFLVLGRLWPSRRPANLYPGVTDDRFVLVLEETDSQRDFERLRKLLEKFGAVNVEECLEEA
jgi:hypothetical protein